MSKPLPLQASLSVWRARALRYALLYVVLAGALLALRYATQQTYPHLRELRTSVAALQSQRDDLELQVQTLTTGPRVLEWANAQGMRPYAQMPKTTADIAPLPAPPASLPPAPAHLEVHVQWK